MKKIDVPLAISLMLCTLIIFGCSESASFFEAVGRNDTAEVKRLLSEGVNVNRKNSDGWTALHIAVEKNSKDVLSLLLEHGADVNAHGQHRVTPLLRGSGQTRPYRNSKALNSWVWIGN